MKKKFILLTLVATQVLFGENTPDHRTIRMQREVPEWCHEDSTTLPFILSMAAYAAKDTVYEFLMHEDDEFLIFTIYNSHCSLCLWFNKNTRECDIEFDALDESFDYALFKKMIDYFLTNY